MHRNNQIEVLVVGAGPVGLMAALALAGRGVTCRIIDESLRPATHSYACALHPATLELLDRVGVAAALLRLGRRVDTVSFYDRTTHHGEVRFAGLGGHFPFLLVVPQSLLENLLEQQLQRTAGVTVEWNHRLWDLRQQRDGVAATVDTLGESAKGYIVPEWDWIVKQRVEHHAKFVIGADGQRSLVRQCLGLDLDRTGKPATYLACEFETETESTAGLRVVLDEPSTNVLWPLPGRRHKWMFELVEDNRQSEFPPKDRSDLVVFDREAEEATRAQITRLAAERAPWFNETIGEIQWTAEVRFHRWLTREFGRDSVWLAGDAAHQTGPVGVQSMNVGMREAVDLGEAIAQTIRTGPSAPLLEQYNTRWRREWEQLLGLAGGLKAREATDTWSARRAARLLSCMPASGADLERLLAQLGSEAATAVSQP